MPPCLKEFLFPPFNIFSLFFYGFILKSSNTKAQNTEMLCLYFLSGADLRMDPKNHRSNSAIIQKFKFLLLASTALLKLTIETKYYLSATRR